MPTKQLIVAQADILSPSGTFANFAPGAWWRTGYLSDADKASSFWTTAFGANFDDLEAAPIVISSFTVGLDRYQIRSTIDGARANSQRFHFDNDNQQLYVSFADRKQYWQFEQRQSGQANTFIDATQQIELGPVFSLLGQEYADPRLVAGSVEDNQTLDSLEDQKFTYDTYSFAIDNTDGELDTIRAQIINQASRILLAEIPDTDTATLDDFELIRYGIVSDVVFQGDQVQVSVVDPRKNYDNEINPNVLTVAEYPNLEDGLVDKSKPLLLGRAIVPGIQVDATEFMASDTFYGNLTTVHDVFVDGVSTGHTVDLAAGTVTIAGYTSGDVTIDCTALDISNIVDQILFLMITFADIEETAEFFDMDSIATMGAKGYTGAYYIDTGGIKLNEALQELASGILTWVIPRTGGVFHFQDITPEEPVYEVLFDEITGLPDRSYNNEIFVSSLQIQYSPDYINDSRLTIKDDSLRDEAIENQSADVTNEFFSTLTSESQAVALNLAFYEQRIFAPEIIELSLPDKLQFDVADYINYTHQRVFDPLGENVKVIVPRSRWRVVQASRIARTATIRRIDDDPITVDDLTYLVFNGDPNNVVYLDFNGNGTNTYIKFGEIG